MAGGRGLVVGAGVVVIAAIAAFLLMPPDVGGGRGAPGPAARPADAAPVEESAPPPPRASAWVLRGHGAVEGILREFGSDRALGGVAVLLVAGEDGPPDALETTTLPDGSFHFPKAPAYGAWSLTARVAPPLATFEMGGIQVAESRVTDLGVLYATPGFEVPGIVVDEAGSPIKGALVRAVRMRPAGVRMDFLRVIRELPHPVAAVDTAITGPDGRFALKKTAPGTYDMEASAKGYRLTVERGAIVGPSSATREIRIVLAGGHGLRGRVLRKTEGPVEGLRVVAIPQPNDDRQLFETAEKSLATTNETGEFELEGLGAGTHVVGVEVANEPYHLAMNVEVPRDGYLEIVIEGDAWLEGVVRDDAGAPIVRAQVYVANFRGMPSVAFAETDAEGKYVIRSLRSGPIQLFMVQAEGFGTFPEDFMPMLRGGASDLILKPGRNEKDVLLGKGGIVRGTVSEMGTQTAVEGVRVSVTGPVAMFGGTRSATSDAQGKFEITSVPVGGGILIASKDGWVQPGLTPQTMMGMAMTMMAGSGAADTGRGLNIVIAKPGDVVERALEMSRGTSIRGVVKDPAGSPVPGARVSVEFASQPGGWMRQLSSFFPLGEPRLSGSDGSFEIPAPPPGQKIAVLAKAQGWLDGRSADLETGAEPLEGVVVSLRQGTVVTGVVKGPDGKPVSGALVRAVLAGEAQGWARSWRLRQSRAWSTDAEGVYRMTQVTPGTLVVQATHASLTSASREGVEAEEGKTVEADFTLGSALSIAGRVLGPDGRPFAGARVNCDRVGGMPAGADPYWDPPDNIRTGADGAFVLQGLVPGRYSLQAEAEGVADGEPVQAEAGGPAVTLNLAQAYVIAGVVRAKRGQPLSNVRVRATRDGGGGNGSANTNREGRFEMRDLPAGTYEVRAEPGWGVGSSRPNLVPVIAEGVPAGSTDVLLEAEEGLRITGTVVRGDGTPVQEGWFNAQQILGAGEKGPAVSVNGPILDGKLEISGLAPGRYRVGVGGNDLPWKQVEAEAGAEGVRVQYGQGGAVEGRVLRADGTPAAVGLWVTATGPDGVTGAPVGAEGRFSIRELPAGTYAIAVSESVDGRAHQARADGVAVANGSATNIGDLVLQQIP
jgi:protocatechuate 3,4-dioxygenase beta subunit